MANNYRQFSFSLKLNDTKESKWFQTQLQRASKKEDSDGIPLTCFDWTVYPNESSKESDPHVWFRDNGESGDVEQIAGFVEKYLKKFKPNGYFEMTWADTCSKQRIGEFGGGIAVVTAETTHWFNDHQWVTRLTENLERRNS